MNGMVVNVSTEFICTSLAQDYTDGFVLYVDDISIFGDEGLLQIGTIWSEDRELTPYVTVVDTDEFVQPYLELGTELVNGYVMDETLIFIYPLTTVKMATIALPGSGDMEMPVSSAVWPLLEDGTRDETEGEIVTIGGGMVTSLYGTPPSISGDYIAFLEAGKISAGTINADEISIKSQDNNTVIDSNGIKVTAFDDAASFVHLDANDQDHHLLKINRGGIEIRDLDETIIIDKDGMVADGIIRGIMPGSNNPIINSSFERLVEGTNDPKYWTKGGSSPGNITTTPAKNRYGTRCFLIDNSTSTNAKATQVIAVQPNTDYALSFYYMCEQLGSLPQWGSGIEYGDGTLFGEGAESGEGERGALIRVLDGSTELISSEFLWGTKDSEWLREITTTFNTGELTEVTIEIAVGTPTAPTIGKLWLDAILLQEGAVIMPWNISLYDFLDHTSDDILHGERQYPVGSIYLNASDNTNPSVLFGFGVWSLMGQGRVLIGLDSGDSDFNSPGETGGNKNVTLNTSMMPVHSHTQNSHNHSQYSHNHSQYAHSHSNAGHAHTSVAAGIHAHTIRRQAQYQTGTNRTGPMYDGSSTYAPGNPILSSGNHSHTINPSAITIYNQTAANYAATASNYAATATNQNAGSGAAHTNVQPYEVVYMWKRTA